MERQAIFPLLVIPLLVSACSIKHVAVNKLGNALAGSGTTFASDDDPELVAGALPFALKLMESLLAESPRHTGLLLAASSGFTQYTYAFVAWPGDRAFYENVEESKALRLRARRLYARAYRYGMRGLDARYPGFAAAFEGEPQTALARVHVRDVPLLYWTAAAQGLAISASKDDPEMIADLPLVEALLRRAEELDPGWQQGALPEVRISIDAAKVGIRPEDRKSRILASYEAALKFSAGRRASLFVSFAENSSLPAQNRTEFKQMLERALVINADAYPESRLANLVAQQRARWLLGRIDDLFLEPESPVVRGE